ncbi:MAG TPA: hypothetical protein VFV19_02160 [Candidatus Polarisedimenticolaceae bacterium]|nr:hypothetical protein [Candidatus Polarisedimenticolaceae bacterium]
MSRSFARAAVVSLALLGGRASAESPPRPVVALILDDASPATRAAALSGIASLGGRTVHAFDGVLIVELPPGSEFRALKLAGVREVALKGAAARAGRGVPGWGLAAWSAIAHLGDRTDERPPAEIGDDALVPPATTLDAVRAARAGVRKVAASSTGSPGAPYGATDLNTSEFFAGAVSINVILVESDGTIEFQSENWSADREDEVVAKIAAGLEWVRLQEPRAGLRFVYHVLAGRVQPAARTGYEPIRHAADPYGTTGEALWATQVLGKLGYTSGDRFARSRALAADTRRYDGTDWAVNVFVVDSLNDVDGKFADGRFAYTWVGGPHIVMTYDNQAWGIDRMDQVLRHEIEHAFYAFDEYASSGCVCTDHRGYLDGPNANCAACNAAAAACVMIANGDSMCDATRRQIGWADLDGDGDLDVVGENPDTFLDALPAQACRIPAVTGVATVVAATNRNTYTATPASNISINRIAGVEVRADGGAWIAASPEDGAWGGPVERFSAALPTLSSGPHTVEARAIDDHGNVDAVPGSASILVAPGSSPLGDTVRVGRDAGPGATLQWSACPGAATYRIYRAAAPSQAFTLAAETSLTTWDDAASGAACYEVRPVDACGNERAD